MNQREHLARQAAASADGLVDHHENGTTPSAVDIAIARANFNAAREAGIHPFELDQYRRTTPQR
jgi:urease alpha subunit